MLWYYYDRFGYKRKTSLNITKGKLESVYRKAKPYNGQQKTEKKTNNDVQNIAQIKHVLKKIQRQEQLNFFLLDWDKRN